MKERIVFLSSWNNPDLPYYMNAFMKAKLPISAVICAGALKDADIEILKNRLEPSFFDRDLMAEELSSTPFYFVKSHNDAKCVRLLKSLKACVLVNAGTPNILKMPILSIPRLGVVNCHPGLMPDYRGCTNVEWAIYNDDPVGSTCHFMTEAIDRGPILFQQEMPIKKGWSYRKIRTAIVHHGINVLTKGIKKAFRLNKNFKKLQVSDQGTYYKVIDPVSMQAVLKKITEGLYKHASDVRGETCAVL